MRTGKIRYRKGWFGKWILQIEVYEDYLVSLAPLPMGSIPATRTVWRDANKYDMKPMNENIAQLRRKQLHPQQVI